jgi:hypothetical protein
LRTILTAAALLATLALAACKPPMKPYDYPQFGFRASFPSPPKITDRPGWPDGSEVHADIVESSGGGRDFAVWVGDVSRANLSIDELTDGAAKHVADGLGGEPGVRTYVATSEGVMGREVPIKKQGAIFVNMRVFLAGGRFYEVVGNSSMGPDDPAVRAFLDSFHVTGMPLAAPANAAPVHDTAVDDALSRQTNEVHAPAAP